MKWMLVLFWGYANSMNVDVSFLPTEAACERAKAAFISEYLPDHAVEESWSTSGLDRKNANRSKCIYIGEPQ